MRLVPHKCLSLWICNAPDTIVIEYCPVVVFAGSQDGVLTADISTDAPGWNPVGPAKCGEKIHGFRAITLLILQGIKGATGISQIACVLYVVRDPAEDILRGFDRFRAFEFFRKPGNLRIIGLAVFFCMKIVPEILFRDQVRCTG